jgi:transcriptional regulator with XRE-family HTH domain
MSEMIKKIGNRIRLLRNFKNYSQENMAELLGMSLAGYSKIERGETDISVSKIEAIAKIFEMDINQFFTTFTDSSSFLLHMSGSNSASQNHNKSATVNYYSDSDKIQKLQKDVENLQNVIEKILSDLKNMKK